MRPGFTALAVFCAVAGLRAAEPARTNDAPDSDPIGAAKREFDQAKAERDGGAAGRKADLPRLGLPEMQLPAGGAVPSSEAEKKKRAKAAEMKSANWLLDAMEKKPDAREGRSRDTIAGRSDEPGGQGDDLSSAPSENAESVGATIVRDAANESAREKRTEDREARRAESMANPLSRYMGEWMTPRDYAVMKPVVDAAARGNESAGSGVNSPLPAGGDTLSLPDTMRPPGEARADERVGFTPPTPQENPYLQVLHTAATPTPQAAIVPPPANPPPPAISSPAPAPEAPRNKRPDFAKPLDDQKYFKPLKKF